MTASDLKPAIFSDSQLEQLTHVDTNELHMMTMLAHAASRQMDLLIVRSHKRTFYKLRKIVNKIKTLKNKSLSKV